MRHGATCWRSGSSAATPIPSDGGASREVNARLADHYAYARMTADAAAERSEVYHRVAAGEPGAFACVPPAVRRRSARFPARGLREALVTIIADLDPLLDDADRAWLRYARARLLADQRRYDQALSMLGSLRDNPVVAGDVELTVLTMLGLHDVQRGQRNFKAALATLGGLLDYLSDKPGSRGRQMEVTQAMASLLAEDARHRGGPRRCWTACWSTPEIPRRVRRCWRGPGTRWAWCTAGSTAPAARSTPSGRR